MKLRKADCSMSLYTPEFAGSTLRLHAIAARFAAEGVISDEHRRFIADMKEKENCFRAVHSIYVKHGYDKTARRLYKIYDKYGFVRP